MAFYGNMSTIAHRVITPVGFWKNLGGVARTTDGRTITPSGFFNRDFYQLLVNIEPREDDTWSNMRPELVFPSEFNNCIQRYIADGVDHTSSNSNPTVLLGGSDRFRSRGGFGVINIKNVDNHTRLVYSKFMFLAESNSSSPHSVHTVAKVFRDGDNDDSIGSFTIDTLEDDLGPGTSVRVLGWDPDDTHTDNFWESLASVRGDSESSVLRGDIVNRKWVMGTIAFAASPAADFRLWRGSTSFHTIVDRASSIGSQLSSASLDSGGFTIFHFWMYNGSGYDKRLLGFSNPYSTTAGASSLLHYSYTAEANHTDQANGIGVSRSSTAFVNTDFVSLWGGN